MAFSGDTPRVDPSAFIAPGAWLIGDVRIEANACVLFNSVLRGDTEAITLGAGSNLQDGVVVHADPGYPVVIGTGVSVGHNATIHGATIADDCLIGMGAILLNGSVVGEGSLIAAGTLVRQGQVIPPGSLVAGVPGVVKRSVSAGELNSIRDNAAHYQRLRETYRAQD